MPALPKPPGTRRRERGSQASWIKLPAAADFNRPPTLPSPKPTWPKSTRQWWRVLWSSPMATTYLEADVPALVRLAEMVEAREVGQGPLSSARRSGRPRPRRAEQVASTSPTRTT